MSTDPQGMKGLSKYFGTVRQSVEAGQEVAAVAVEAIIETIANGPVALVRQARESVISHEMHLSGTLLCAGNLTIDGTLVGDVRARGHVRVGGHGVVLGNIHAEEITVQGRTEGRLTARNVLLCRSSWVKGEVRHAQIEIENGAHFEGDCGRADNPERELRRRSES